MVFHCLFEQSGTFKNEFIKLGHTAYDYDILDDFGQTDFRVDLFRAIEDCLAGLPTLFDGFASDDVLLAFFPCIRFEAQSTLLFTCRASQYRALSVLDRLRLNDSYIGELCRYVHLLNGLVEIALDKGLRLVIENPYRPNCNYFLFSHWPFKPDVLISNRRDYGDSFKKPTGFWFFGWKPYDNLLFDEPIANYPLKRVACGQSTVGRSLITHDFARRFIRMHLLPG